MSPSMDATTPTSTSRSRIGYQNLMLTLLVAGVGVLILDRAPSSAAPLGVSTALAGPPEDDASDPSGRTSAAEQRKQIIAELKALNTKVGQLDATIRKGIKITDMPQVKDSGAVPTKSN